MMLCKRQSYLIFGILLFGYLNCLVLAEKYPAKDKLAKQSEEGVQNVDYEEYSDDEESTVEKTKIATPTVMPYFKEKNYTSYVKYGDKVTLDCPVNNYNDTQHQILWYKGKNVITNGPLALQETYQVDTNFNLIIDKFTNDLQGDYFCNVMPQNVSRHILVKIGERTDNSNTSPELIQVKKKSSADIIHSVFSTVAIVVFTAILVPKVTL